MKHLKILTIVLITINVIVGIGLPASYIYVMFCSPDIQSYLYFYDIIFCLGIVFPLLTISRLMFKTYKFLQNKNKSTH